jgi:hypothetical protein
MSDSEYNDDDSDCSEDGLKFKRSNSKNKKKKKIEEKLILLVLHMLASAYYI